MNDNNEQRKYAHDNVENLHSEEFTLEKKQNQGFFSKLILNIRSLFNFNRLTKEEKAFLDEIGEANNIRSQDVNNLSTPTENLQMTSHEGLTEREISQIQGARHLNEVSEELARIQREELGKQHKKQETEKTSNPTEKKILSTNRANNPLIQRIRNCFTKNKKTAPMLDFNSGSKERSRNTSQSNGIS